MVLRQAPPARRRVVPDLATDLAGLHATGQVRLIPTGQHGVDLDAIRREFDRQRTGQTDQTGLCGGVVREVG
jgi:hypothetical protein